MSKTKKSGFSLVELMVAIGLIGGLGMVVMQITKSSSKGKVDIQNLADYSSMQDEINLLLGTPRSCKASFQGVTFNGSNIRTTPKTGLEIWSADQDGVRVTQKFSTGKKIGKLEISEISFLMPDYTAGVNWEEGSGQSFTAEVTLKGTKFNMGSSRSINDIKKMVTLTFDTNAAGLSTINGCGGASGGGGTGGVLVKGVVDLGTGNTHTESITIDEDGVLMMTGWGHQVSIIGGSANAGIRGTLRVDGVTCSSDYSFEGETSSVIFDVSPTCILPLTAGTHSLEFVISNQMAQASTKTGKLSWVVIKE